MRMSERERVREREKERERERKRRIVGRKTTKIDRFTEEKETEFRS